MTAKWIEEYNYRRPHEGLHGATPMEWKQMADVHRKKGAAPCSVNGAVAAPFKL